MTLPRLSQLATAGRCIEDRLYAVALIIIGILPVLELCLRTCCNSGLRGATSYVQHLTLWIGWLDAMTAAQQRQHLSFSTDLLFLPPGLQGKKATALATLASTSVAAGLFWASLQFVRGDMAAPANIAGWLLIWVAEMILPLAFASLTLRFVWQAGGWRARLLAGLGIPAAAAIGFILAGPLQRRLRARVAYDVPLEDSRA